MGARSRNRRHRPARARPTVRAAVVSIGGETVVVVVVPLSLVTDPFQSQIAMRALELTLASPVVLWGREPCGCDHMLGAQEHLDAIKRMPESAFHWQPLGIELPTGRPPPVVRGLPN